LSPSHVRGRATISLCGSLGFAVQPHSDGLPPECDARRASSHSWMDRRALAMVARSHDLLQTRRLVSLARELGGPGSSALSHQGNQTEWFPVVTTSPTLLNPRRSGCKAACAGAKPCTCSGQSENPRWCMVAAGRGSPQGLRTRTRVGPGLATRQGAALARRFPERSLRRTCW
jgi:hypothetical protein